jgi:prevent-host-death family protein
MTEVVSRELRNDTAGLLRRVQAGEDITVTVNGKAVALLTGLRQELAELAGDTTDELGPLL